MRRDKTWVTFVCELPGSEVPGIRMWQMFIMMAFLGVVGAVGQWATKTNGSSTITARDRAYQPAHQYRSYVCTCLCKRNAHDLQGHMGDFKPVMHLVGGILQKRIV